MDRLYPIPDDFEATIRILAEAADQVEGYLAEVPLHEREGEVGL